MLRLEINYLRLFNNWIQNLILQKLNFFDLLLWTSTTANCLFLCCSCQQQMTKRIAVSKMLIDILHVHHVNINLKTISYLYGGSKCISNYFPIQSKILSFVYKLITCIISQRLAALYNRCIMCDGCIDILIIQIITRYFWLPHEFVEYIDMNGNILL